MGHNETKDANGKSIDLEQVDEIFRFLQGEKVGTVQCKEMPHLSPEEAFSVIYFLQEGVELLPDRIEQCLGCLQLLDADCCGYYKEDVGHYCDDCS